MISAGSPIRYSGPRRHSCTGTRSWISGTTRLATRGSTMPFGRLRVAQRREQPVGHLVGECVEERVVPALVETPEPLALVRAGDLPRTGVRPRRAVRAAVAAELGRDRTVGQVDVGEPRVQPALDRLARAEQARGRRVLPRADDAGVLEHVLGRAAARAAVQVRRHVAGVGLRERADEVRLRLRQVVGPVLDPLPPVGRVALVVAADQPVAVAHRRPVRGEPVDGTDRPAVASDRQQRGLRVDRVGEERAVGVRVERERGRRPVDARVTQFAERERERGRREIVVRGGDRIDDAVDDGGERLRVEAAGRDVVQRVVRVAAGAAVRVRAGQHRVDVAVQLAVVGGQAPQDLLPHAVEDQRQLADDEQQPIVGRGGRGEDERTGPQPQVDAGALLIGLAVAHHPAVGGLAGDVAHSAPDQVPVHA